MRILVVDDLVDAAESLALLLRAIGDYEVRTAYDGPAALAEAQEQRPHAIFLDIALPRLNGYRVAEQIRGNTALQGACLIALTGYGQASDVEEAKQAGFDHHLLKPVDLAQLESVLAQVRSRLA
jgi:CheY-like chemotaxis protein